MMAAQNDLTSTARSSYPVPALTAMGAIAELPLTPRLTRATIDTTVRADIARATGRWLPPTGAEKRVLPRPDWVPRLSWKTGAVALGVGLLVFFAVKQHAHFG